VKCRDFVNDRYWCVPMDIAVPQALQDKLKKLMSTHDWH
jgi:hypothetical protein